MEVEIDPSNKLDGQNFLFNPIIKKAWEGNPFKSTDRLYPVDFGVPVEQVTILNLEYSPQYEIGEIPSKVGMTLPQGGGQFVLDFQNGSNKISMNNSLFISRSIFASQEYHHLKELFNQVVAAQQTEWFLRRRNKEFSNPNADYKTHKKVDLVSAIQVLFSYETILTFPVVRFFAFRCCRARS
jgi:hypothetical protein